ncbi:MAG TPA: GTPase ObgE [Gemmatimonadales bacterium]|jgi:GTP-binding protein
MSFVDRIVVDISAGDGGDGVASFARFKYRPKGGPDGGDGGHGGSVYVEAQDNLATLLDYQYHPIWRAARGGHGKGKNKTGATADDIVLPVPAGTLVEDEATGQRLGELLHAGDRVLVARGGKGGRGNSRFTSATHQAPREFEPGGKGQERRLVFTLKLIADVGLVGQPNAGKSTLLSVVSAARPKIADYPFTTLEPNLGVIALSGSRTFVMADIPGIIEGAHQGKGLGLRFLQHVERTRVLAYLLPLDVEEINATYVGLRREVALYSATLAAKPHVVVLTKRDLLADDAELPVLDAPDALRVVAISSAAGSGLEELKELLWTIVQGARANAVEEEDGHDDDRDSRWEEPDPEQ